ncbi:hypothetical protein BCR44DRAFT_1425923 [Catenaria anguillulae PL171]|uniref:Secreted protein n=1 Tax=Catenaria anguillulae PL171 TaxID=765915 RepID=A0A1Y2HZ96_9FUNG|nr:hypothetical protein BCR44DRAFT_1425923 [Catenaria anguillulae PL171]
MNCCAFSLLASASSSTSSSAESAALSTLFCLLFLMSAPSVGPSSMCISSLTKSNPHSSRDRASASLASCPPNRSNRFNIMTWRFRSPWTYSMAAVKSGADGGWFVKRGRASCHMRSTSR